MHSFKWKHVLEQLQKLTPEQLEMPVCALIDLEPWDAEEIQITPANDEWRPNQPYLVFS